MSIIKTGDRSNVNYIYIHIYAYCSRTSAKFKNRCKPSRLVFFLECAALARSNNQLSSEN